MRLRKPEMKAKKRVKRQVNKVSVAPGANASGVFLFENVTKGRPVGMPSAPSRCNAYGKLTANIP